MTVSTAPSVRRRRPPRPPGGFDPRRPFTTEEAQLAGISRKQLRGRAWRTLAHGVHVRADVPDSPTLAAQALLVVAPAEAWVSHATAARVLGVPLPPLPGEHLSVPTAADRVARAGVACHVAERSAIAVTAEGVLLSAPARVFVELAQQLTLVDLVVVGDWLVAHRLVRLSELRAFVAASRLAGSGAARAAAAFVRERVDSPMETRLRMLFVLAGLPEPEVNLTFDLGGGRRRFDLSWPGVKVIAEYDGRHHAERESQWEDDLARRESIDDDAWRIRVFTAKDIYSRPDLALERMAALLRSRGLRGVPARLVDGWRAHFPVRRGYL